MIETRTLEKKGIIKFSADDRKALTVLVTCEVLQRPYSQYLNTKSSPVTSFYGYACVMANEYVVTKIPLEFVRQIIMDSRDYETQLGYQEYCNARAILSAVTGNPTIDTRVKFPARIITEIRFKLEPGVIVFVQKDTVSMVTCGGDGVEQPDRGTPLPNSSGDPIAANPDGSSSIPGFNPSLPYDGASDNGNSYYPVSASTKTRFWLVGTYLDGNGQYQPQTGEPTDPSGYLDVTGNPAGITLQQTPVYGTGPDGQRVYVYKLSTGQTFNGGWKPTPKLNQRTITA